MTANIIVYSLNVCPNCNLLKDALSSDSIKFKEEDMESTDSRTRLLMHSVFTAVAPVLEVDGQFYKYPELFPNGELDIPNLQRIVGE